MLISYEVACSIMIQSVTSEYDGEESLYLSCVPVSSVAVSVVPVITQCPCNDVTICDCITRDLSCDHMRLQVTSV